MLCGGVKGDPYHPELRKFLCLLSAFLMAYWRYPLRNYTVESTTYLLKIIIVRLHSIPYDSVS